MNLGLGYGTTLRTTWQIGRYGEGVAKNWLWKVHHIKTAPFTIRSAQLGTSRVDLYSKERAHVYEVKMGRLDLGRMAGQAYFLRKLIEAGTIKGATAISVEHRQKVGFSPSLMVSLKEKRIGMISLRRVLRAGKHYFVSV